jgi:hypothetical protein
MYSLKMYPLSVPKEAGMSYHRLPKWGTIVDGVLYPLHPLEPATEEKDGSVWLGTPTAGSGTKGRSKRYRGINKLPTPQEFVRMWPTPCTRDVTKPGPNSTQYSLSREATKETGGKLNPTWVELLMGYPPGWTKIT